MEPAPAKSLGQIPLNIHQLRSNARGQSIMQGLGIWEGSASQRYAQRERGSGAYNRERYQLTSRPYSAPFLGWDGEGVTVKGTHRYILLANSEGETLSNVKGLSTQDCLEFVLTAGQRNPWANHVMFAGGYDANMMLCDMGYWEVRRLTQRGRIRWEDKLIEYRPGKHLKLTQLKLPYRVEYKGKMGWNRAHSVTLWDTFGFFQMSFVKSLLLWLPELESQLDLIRQMKAERSNFQAGDLSQITKYCLEEVEYLATMMEELRKRAIEVDCCPSAWYGPGAISSTILRRQRIKQYRDPDLANGKLLSDIHPHRSADLLEDIARASRHAYFGGRIEMVRFGHHVGPVYAHDIVSAYPSVMAELPCLAHGQWVRSNGKYSPDQSRFTLWRLTYDAQDIRGFHPFPWRDETGHVYFPPLSNGWYWTPERFAAAQGHTVPEVHEALSFHPDCDHQPFSFIPQLFDKRRAMKRNGHPAEKVLKLALNSMYGKLCQRVGGKQGAPAFHQLEWAGFITSETRARIYKLAMQAPESVIAFETDGIYTTERLCENGDGSLGSWEVTEYDEIVYLQSGMYFLRKGDVWHQRYRGLDPGSLTVDMVLEGWRRQAKEVESTHTRFRGMSTSVASPPRFAEWRQWITEPKQLSLSPRGKRAAETLGSPASQLISTIATGGGGMMSHPHPISWIDGSQRIRAEDLFYLSEEEILEDGWNW